jgi:hypothetical protein
MTVSALQKLARLGDGVPGRADPNWLGRREFGPVRGRDTCHCLSRQHRNPPARHLCRLSQAASRTPSGLPGYAGMTRGASSPQQRTLPSRDLRIDAYSQNQGINGNIVPSPNGDIDGGQPTGPRRVRPNGTRGKKGSLGISRYSIAPSPHGPYVI